MIVYGRKYNVSIFKRDLKVSFDHPASLGGLGGQQVNNRNFPLLGTKDRFYNFHIV